MRVAIAHNLRTTDDVSEVVFTSRETVDSVAEAIAGLGHEPVPVEVSGPVADTVERLEDCAPDLVYNLAEGWTDGARQPFYTGLYAALGLPFTGSPAHVQALAMDKYATKLVVAGHGVRTPRSQFLRDARDLDPARFEPPVIVKPNHEGTSRGITQESVVDSAAEAAALAADLLREYGAGVLVEEYVPGVDVTVPWLEIAGDDGGGALDATEVLIHDLAASGRRHGIMDYGFKNYSNRPLTGVAPSASFRTPARLPSAVLAELAASTATTARALGCRDLARVDFRVGDDGVPHLLEVNVLPGLDPTQSIHHAGRLAGLHPTQGVVRAVVASAARRWGLAAEPVQPTAVGV
ncbi:D-alanine--D-alanine ligase family protein [Saccharothrix australiensis]|uniref:D-alanine-D-alanine ligase-like ATP-grasp enzyme n=1 Tax=Saccharothrix australiensis TaxID=2072 RepID=A0A495VZU9_9PSEU|nr:hypothetical protein [Saccharothrix australiensis]RKT54674.1 D-alanine-D-alanine ligase-like ATP-grasp enzyme [Saccharothrix australiensis]